MSMTPSSRYCEADRHPARPLIGLAVTLFLLATTATPAAADPARPTNDRSRILSIRPTLPAGVSVRVVGGDAFLELEVARGHRAIVRDYPSDPDQVPPPYLRFLPSGVVERNEHSTASVANETRYGRSTRTPDPGAQPRWKVVAHNGRYTWHDHRIHWMLPSTAEVVDRNGRVDLGGPNGTWSVPVEVDGTTVTIRGELIRLIPPAVWPWVLLSAVIVMGSVGLGVWTRRPPRASVPYRLVAIVGGGVAIGAAGVGLASWRSIPAVAGGNPLPFVVPLVGIVAAIIVILGPRAIRVVALGAMAASLLGWALVRVGVLTHAVLPTSIPFDVDRLVTAVALGVGIAVALLLVWLPPPRPGHRSTTPEHRTSDH